MPKLRILAPSDRYQISYDVFPLGIASEDYNYEITITFNPQLYTVGSATDEGLETVETSLIRWLEDNVNITQVTLVLEYQKNRYPHLHICVSSSERLDISFRQQILKGLVRIAGRSTFKPVIDVYKFEEYMMKDLKHNFELTGTIHYKVYTLED